MGLFDTVKLKANALAADVERAGKVTAAQARTMTLQSDIRKAERELGHSAFFLIESGEIAHPDLDAAAARLGEARQALRDKEAEIEALRRGEEADDTAAPAPPVVVVAAEPAVEAAAEPAATTTPAAAEVAAATLEVPVAPPEPAGKPAAKRRAPVTKKAAAVRKPAAKKPSPAKKPATKRPPATKPAAKRPPAADA